MIRDVDCDPLSPPLHVLSADYQLTTIISSKLPMSRLHEFFLQQAGLFFSYEESRIHSIDAEQIIAREKETWFFNEHHRLQCTVAQALERPSTLSA